MQLREGLLTVGALAAWLDLMLPTVSGVLADRAGLIIRHFSASLYIPAGALLSADPRVVACHLVGRLLDLSHVS
jgi:hypothetical protein